MPVIQTPGLENIERRLEHLEHTEAQWIRARLDNVRFSLGDIDNFPHRLIGPHTAHLRLIEFGLDASQQRFSELGRVTLFDIADDFAQAHNFSPDAVRVNLAAAKLS